MVFERIEDLPEEVRDIIFSIKIFEEKKKIFDKYFLDEDQGNFLLNLEQKVYLKKVSPLDLPNYLEDLEGAKFIDLRSLALDFSLNILWPLQSYLEQVDRLILRLGGKVPRLVPLRRSTDLQKRLFPEQDAGTVKELLEKYEDFKDLFLSARKIIDREGRLISPTVDNWLKDYIHFSGASYHDSLQRSEYLAKGANIPLLSSKEKESLRFFLTSYDDNLKMLFRLENGLLAVSEFSEPPAVEENIDLDKVIERFKSALTALENRILSTSFILSEAQNDLAKLREILWQAIGLGDSNKAISCLKILIEKRALDAMLKEDGRFKSILLRFINVRYGKRMEVWLDNNQDKLLIRRLFLEMILSEKLGLASEQALLTAFYLTNLVPDSGQVVYVDGVMGYLKWREIQLLGSQLSWIDKLS
jgi:hypothetical protein